MNKKIEIIRFDKGQEKRVNKVGIHVVAEMIYKLREEMSQEINGVVPEHEVGESTIADHELTRLDDNLIVLNLVGFRNLKSLEEFQSAFREIQGSKINGVDVEQARFDIRKKMAVNAGFNNSAEVRKEILTAFLVSMIGNAYMKFHNLEKGNYIALNLILLTVFVILIEGKKPDYTKFNVKLGSKEEILNSYEQMAYLLTGELIKTREKINTVIQTANVVNDDSFLKLNEPYLNRLFIETKLYKWLVDCAKVYSKIRIGFEGNEFGIEQVIDENKKNK